MYKLVTIIFVFASLALLSRCTADSNSPKEEIASSEAPELAEVMGTIQRFSHKLALSVEGENSELASFYLHEIEEAVEETKEEIPEYDGYDINTLMEEMFEPTVETVETALDNNDWEDIRRQTVAMIDSCNDCHTATNHSFIDITPGFDKNPYNQTFSDK